MHRSNNMDPALARSPGVETVPMESPAGRKSNAGTQGRSRTAPGRRGSARTVLCLIGVLVLAGALRWVFMVGPAGSDDARYMRAAESFGTGERIARLDHAYVRAAYILWLTLWMKLGAGTFGWVVSEVVLSLGIILAVYRLAVRWADRSVALLTALWLAFFPLDVLTSGLVLPDRFALLLALLAAGCAQDALTAGAGRGRASLIAASVFTGLAVSAKEPYAILPIIFGVWALWRVRPLKTAILRSVAIGALAVVVFCFEFAFFKVWANNWWYRFEALSSVYDTGDGGYAIGLRELVYYPAQILANPAVFGLFGWMLFAGLFRSTGKLKDSTFIVVWTLGFFLFLQYGSSSLSTYHPVPKQWRYALPILILLFIPLGQWTLQMFRSSSAGKLATCLLCAGVMITGVIAANERAAERLYLEESPRCLDIVLQRHHAGELAKVALPEWVRRGTSPFTEEAVVEWTVLDLSDGLQHAEALQLIENDQLLMVPEVMWERKKDEDAYVQLKDQLDRHAVSTPIRDWRSPLDRFAAAFGPLASLAKQTTIGRLYRLDADDLRIFDEPERLRADGSAPPQGSRHLNPAHLSAGERSHFDGTAAGYDGR